MAVWEVTEAELEAVLEAVPVEDPEVAGVVVAGALVGVVVAPVPAAPDAPDVQETAEGTETPAAVQIWIFTSCSGQQWVLQMRSPPLPCEGRSSQERERAREDSK